MAVQQRDGGGAADALSEIRAFNKTNPQYAITRLTLDRSQRARARHVALSDHGITVTRRMKTLEQGNVSEC